MIIHIDMMTPGAYPLSKGQSSSLLRFCLSVGVTVFTVNFLYVKGEDSEQLANDFYSRLEPFSAGAKLLEKVYGNGFHHQECWLFDKKSIEAILSETHGNLFAYLTPQLPEDWLFYVDDAILLQIVSHEHEATLRLNDTQYAEFQQLGIPHKRGNPQWSGLPEEAIRNTPMA